MVKTYKCMGVSRFRGTPIVLTNITNRTSVEGSHPINSLPNELVPSSAVTIENSARL